MKMMLTVPDPNRHFRQTGVTAWRVVTLLALAGLAVLLLPPLFLRPRARAAMPVCVNCLVQIEGAKEQWALEYKKSSADIPTDPDLFGTDRYIKIKPSCPEGGTYTLHPVARRPGCSIDRHTVAYLLKNPLRQPTTCVDFLEIFAAAKAQWAKANNASSNTIPSKRAVFSAIRETARTYGIPVPKLECPNKGTYTLGPIDQPPRCSAPGHTVPD